MKRGINSIITTEQIATVFGGALAYKFPRPFLARKVCEMRAQGFEFPAISKKYGLSQYTCMSIVKKAIRLFKVFGKDDAT